MPNTGALKDINADNKIDLLSDISKYDKFEEGATLIGIVCIKDPPREEVKPAIQDCKTAGIRVIMITGDSRETALAVAKDLNIVEKDQNDFECCFTGAQFAAMSKAEKREAVGGVKGKVFARVEPSHKRELVKELIEQG